MLQLFKQHLNSRLQLLYPLMQSLNIETLYIESGKSEYYYLDDQAPPFKENPHFLYFCPPLGENHVLEINLNQKPILHLYSPKDFWHQPNKWEQLEWIHSFEIKPYDNQKSFWQNAVLKNSQLLSPNPQISTVPGLHTASMRLINELNWMRLSKTRYEVECIRKANQLASLGHIAARDCFYNGGSEFDIMIAYLTATGQREFQLPYNCIIALDHHAAILHYQNLSYRKPGLSFLIDAGARYQGYCSDISRTYFQEKAHTVFKSLCDSVTSLQKKLCLGVNVGIPYLEIQEQAFQGITQILIDSEIVQLSLQEAHDTCIARFFFPHGVGHGLGIQVHDVGGNQISAKGDIAPKDERHPFLRTTRTVKNNDILTIEPGLYFIPQMLEELKNLEKLKNCINWQLIDNIESLGGIRIEDNIWVSESGVQNLTREYLS